MLVRVSQLFVTVRFDILTLGAQPGFWKLCSLTITEEWTHGMLQLVVGYLYDAEQEAVMISKEL